MAVRNYDSPDPKRVVTNLRRVLEARDMRLLEKGSYQFVITHCGFIAHYDHGGFVATYQDDLPALVDGFLSQLGMGWDTFLDNKKSYLYDVSFKGKLLTDIIRELLPIFQSYAPAIQLAHQTAQRARRIAAMKALAQELGYTVTPKE